MIKAYLNLVIRQPVIFLSLLGLITLALGLGMLQLRFDHSIEAFMPKDDPAYVQYKKAQETFGDNSRFLIMAVSSENLFSHKALSAFDRFISDLEVYRDFDAEKAKQRQKRLHDLLADPDTGFEEIAAAFSDEPAFVRLLKRKVPQKVRQANQLGPGGVRRLKESVKQDIRLQKTEVIDTIVSPFTANDITGKDDVLETYPLVAENAAGERIVPETSREMAEFKQRLKRNPAFERGLYAVDEKTGRITDFAVMVRFADTEQRPEMVDEIREIAASHKTLDVVTSGVPYISRQFNRYMEKDLYRSTPLVLMVVTLVFFLNFRSMRGVILPLATLGMAEVWTLGLMGYLGWPITTIAITLPPLLISVGSSYAIHVLNQYYADFNLIDPGQKGRGILSVMTHISLTVTLAGLTTAAAFITLISSQLTAIQQWAVFAGLGILFAVGIAITLIPAALQLMPHRYPGGMLKKRQSSDFALVDWLLAATAKGALRHSGKVYAVLLVVLVVSVIGALQMKVDTEFLHYFRKSDPTRRNTVQLGDKFGGAWAVNIIIDSGKTNGVKSPKFLQTVENLRSWLVAGENADLNVGRTDAFSDAIKRMHMAMHNGDPEFFRIPADRMTIMDYLAIYGGADSDSDGVYDDFEPFVDVFYQKTNVLARLTTKQADRLGTTQIRQILGKINAHLEQTLPDDYGYEVTGYPAVNLKLAHYVVTSQLVGLALSLVFVVVVITALFRKFAAAPMALIDMGVTILINFGIMGWFGIELDMVTSVIATITIGIGVDDTIHFLNTYRFYRPQCETVEETIEQTLFVSGKAIMFTSLALTFGFLSMVTSNFLPIVLFSVLTALTMINTTIGSILLIPAAIGLTGVELGKPANKGADG